jgi:hypothetical protein
VIHSIRTVPTMPFLPQIAELGDEPTQLRRLEYATEVQLHRIQEKKEKAIEALK